MKFLLDAQLPLSLKQLFIENGYDCIHTLDLELCNETPDKIINEVSISEQRVVVTNNSDFYDSFVVKREPYKLILVKLGNASKNDLLEFFRNQFSEIIERIKIEDMVLLKKRD
jgi:predicted nuclease of predicted toxin-antitoxin system